MIWVIHPLYVFLNEGGERAPDAWHLYPLTLGRFGGRCWREQGWIPRPSASHLSVLRAPGTPPGSISGVTYILGTADIKTKTLGELARYEASLRFRNTDCSKFAGSHNRQIPIPLALSVPTSLGTRSGLGSHTRQTDSTVTLHLFTFKNRISGLPWRSNG